MKARSFLVGSALLLCLASGALGGGAYQRTKDGKTLVWNPDPKAEDAATWSGGRDSKRYATGHGTLTWYKIERRYGMGSHAGVEKEIPVIRYSGNMVRGKFEGPVVALDEQGKKSHATFADGVRSDEWTADAARGPSPPAIASPTPNEPMRKAEAPAPQAPVAAKPEEVPSPIPGTEQRHEIVRPAVAASSPAAPTPPTQPAASLAPLPVARPTAEREIGERTGTMAPKERQASELSSTGTVGRSTSQPFPTTRSTRRGTIDAKDLLQSLVVPPSTIPSLMKIRGEVPPDGSSPQPAASATSTPAPHLTSTEVVGLADAEARIRGYDLDTYQRPQAQYRAASDTWSVSYSQKSAAGSAGTAKNFTIRVEDKTKNMSIDR